jgi:hypothetical protein
MLRHHQRQLQKHLLIWAKLVKGSSNWMLLLVMQQQLRAMLQLCISLRAQILASTGMPPGQQQLMQACLQAERPRLHGNQLMKHSTSTCTASAGTLAAAAMLPQAAAVMSAEAAVGTALAVAVRLESHLQQQQQLLWKVARK